MDRRTDRLTALHVDLAANIAAVFGMYPAVCHLHEKHVPLSVVSRVILELGPRRGNRALTEWQRPTSARPEPSSRGAPRIPRIGAAAR